VTRKHENGNHLKIAILTRGLSNVMGGMERQLLSIASGLLDRGHNITIISLDESAARPFFESDPRIEFIGLSIGDSTIKATFTERYQRQKKVFNIFKHLKIDVAITFMTGSFWFSILPAKILGIPVVLAERNGPSIYTRTKVRRMKEIIFASMVLASAITVQFDSYRRSYPFYLRNRIVTIPNKIPNFVEKNRKEIRPFVFLFAGRLSNQKQINELVLAFIEFNKRYSNTLLKIYGEGEQKISIEALIKNNSVENIIQLHPATRNIEEAFSSANVLIAPSLWEGFPNSVAEALAAGLPVGGFTDCEGVRDLVMSGSSGWLVHRSDPIASQVELLETIYLARDDIERYSKEARQSVLKYQGEEPNKNWNQLLENLVGK
jgi:glycosyltransferase involved in cell wall biosynthesis